MAVKLKPLFDMRSTPTVICDISDTQQDIFMLAVRMGFDDDDFIKKYMNSDFVKRSMDAGYSWFQMADAEDCMDFILKEFTPKKNNMHYNPDAIEWIGWMYRYIQLRFEIPSSEIYKKLPLDKMLCYYKDMHTQDAEYFVNTIKDSLCHYQ